MPSLAFLYSRRPAVAPGKLCPHAAGQPPADRILDRYLQALGGADRLSTLASFVASGTYMGYDDTEKSALEIFANAQGQRTTVVHGRAGDTTTTLDGRNGWIAGPLSERPVPL